MNTPSISASAIESFDPALGGCARKWAFGRLDGVPRPSSPGAALGTRCHELWAEYLKNGTPFDLSTPEGRICHATQHLLPAPCGPIDVELEFRFTWEGVEWHGFKDAVYMTEDRDFGDNDIVVLDHKTTSDFRYAKRERAELIGHPQAPLYAVSELRFDDVPSTEQVQLAWNYVRHGVTFDKSAPPGPYGYTIKRAGKPVALDPPVRIVVSRAEAEDALGRHVPTAKRMLKIIAEPPAPVVDENGAASIARALEPNPDACDAFGGCPYRSQCGLTPQDIAARMSRLFVRDGGEGEQKDMSSALRDRIAQIKAERAAGTSTPTQSTTVGVQQAIAAEAAARVGRYAQETRTSFAAASGTLEGTSLQDMARVAAAFGPVNPPESALPAPTTTDALTAEAQKNGEYATSPLPPAEAPTTPDAPAPKRRGRPPGSRNKVKGPGTESVNAGPSPETFDTVPAAAPDAELVSDDVMAEIVRRLESDETFGDIVRATVRNALRAL